MHSAPGSAGGSPLQFVGGLPMEGEVFRVCDRPIRGLDDVAYVCQVCGRRLDDGRWEGWIEFVPVGGGLFLRSPRETVQSTRRSFEAWADRLGDVYLEGSLARALYLERLPARPPPRAPQRPHFGGPAPGRGAETSPDDAVVNPFVHYHEGEWALRNRLRELCAADLRTLIRAYRLEAARPEADTLGRPELIELIIESVRRRMEG